MEQFEYDSIMDKYSKQYDVELDNYTRKSLVLFHQRMEGVTPISFDILCKQMALEQMCNKIKPGMDLYSRVYSLHAQN